MAHLVVALLTVLPLLLSLILVSLILILSIVFIIAVVTVKRPPQQVLLVVLSWCFIELQQVIIVLPNLWLQRLLLLGWPASPPPAAATGAAWLC